MKTFLASVRRLHSDLENTDSAGTIFYSPDAEKLGDRAWSPKQRKLGFVEPDAFLSGRASRSSIIDI
jgi:hypothetical protein